MITSVLDYGPVVWFLSFTSRFKDELILETKFLQQTVLSAALKCFVYVQTVEQSSMHRVDLGAVGELAIAQDLILQGWEVFRAIHNNTRVDLVAIKGDQIRKIQVKASSECKNGSIPLYLHKTHLNPKYDYKYEANDFDCFALYCVTTKACIYVPVEEALSVKRTMMFRVLDAKNNQAKGTRHAKDYEILK